MDILSQTGRTGNSSKISLLFLPALSAIVAFHVSKITAEEILEHPFIAQNEIKSETCLTCHPGKKDGKFVHTALALGCLSCHRVTSEKNTTTVNFVATGSALCATCHQPQKGRLLHKPFADGQCLICHNPHASEFKAQTRASVDSLCLSCHGAGRPDVRVDAKTQTVSLLDGRTYDLASFEEAPKVGGDHAQVSMPPRVGRAVAANASRKADVNQDCLSCHDPHSSEKPHLLRKTADCARANPVLRLCFQSRPRHADGTPREVGTYQDRLTRRCA